MRINAKHIIGAISRTLLALTFLFSGFVKAVDPLGTVYKIEDYLKAFGGFANELLPLAGAAAVCLIIVEWLLGVCMLANIRTRWTSWLALAFYLVMTPLTLWIALTNPISDCGCFGDALVLTNWQTFWKNIVLLSLVVILLACRKAIPQTFTWPAEIIIAGIGLGALINIMCYSYNHLPPMDFRPYKIGTDLRKMIEVPEEQRPQFEVTIVYEKDGETLELGIDDDDPDSTWTYVETRRKQISGASQQIINDFYIEYDDEDVASDVLANEGSTLLLCAPDLQTADESIMDKINDLYDYAQANDIMFLCLTASDEQSRIRWADYTGAEYEFYTSDERTLKTMVRSNPGLILLQDGKVIKKWSHWNFPSQIEVQGFATPTHTPKGP